MARFSRGKSGNPNGRPAGSRNRASIWLDRIAEDQVGYVLKAVLRRARHGDMRAAGIILSRCWPARKARLRFQMPQVNTAADLPRALAAIASAVSTGELTPDEAQALAIVFNAQMRAIELVELDQRMKEIEMRQANAA